MQIPPFNSGIATQSTTLSLTAEQKETVTSVLKDFDAENISEADAKLIATAFKEAGIQPSQQLAQALSDEGFDARDIGQKAGAGRPDGPPPPPKQENDETSFNTSALQTLQDILDEYELDSLTAEEEQDILTALEKEGFLDNQGSIISIVI